MRNTLLVISTLALIAGCDEPPPPGANATPEPPGSGVSKQGARMHTSKIRPGFHRPMLQLGGGSADGGDALDGGATTDGGDAPDGAAAPAATRTWSFDADKPGAPPTGFELAAGAGKPGKWLVQAEAGGPSAPNVLAQLDGDRTAERFLTAVAAEPSVRDGRASVRCQLVSGKIDQACGLVIRFKDAKSYYVARASAVEKDVNLYVIKDGKRRLLGGAKGAIAAGWHELRIDARGDHFEVLWDGGRVYAGDDKTFPDAGRVGVWTRADSVTYFDDLSVTPL